MPIPIRQLLVLPNPWVVGCIDHLGRPAGRLPVDFYEHSQTPATFVGCRFAEVKEIAAAQIQKLGKREIEIAPARHDHRIAYSREPVSIPNSAYYRDAIKRGDLIAADERTARVSGLVKFVKPEEALAKAREEAIKHFNDHTAEDAHEEMGACEPLWFDDEPTGGSPAAKTASSAPAVATSKPTDSKGGV